MLNRLPGDARLFKAITQALPMKRATEAAMTPLEAARFLALSGSIAIFFSAWVGVMMLFPRRERPADPDRRPVNMKQIGAAHLDWIMLGLMQALAGMLLWLFDTTPIALSVWLIAFGGWVNPLSYVFRAFGINAFVYGGGPLQKVGAVVGGLSSLSIIAGWSLIFWQIAA